MEPQKNAMKERTALCIILLSVALSGCGTLSFGTQEERVATRAQERVDALMIRDFETAYALTTPGYRSTETIARYSSRWGGSGMWSKALVQEVECNRPEGADRCEVLLTVTYRHLPLDEMTTDLQEEWIYVAGDWYLYQNISGN